jgi:hypothetical protein
VFSFWIAQAKFFADIGKVASDGCCFHIKRSGDSFVCLTRQKCLHYLPLPGCQLFINGVKLCFPHASNPIGQTDS